jgi:hypothetical protein
LKAPLSATKSRRTPTKRTGQEETMNKQEPIREAAPKSSPHATLTRISTLTRQLSEALNYATSSSTDSYWTAAQKRRAWQSIERKKAECRRLIASLATPFKKRLHDVTEAAWRAAEEEHRDRPDPEAPLLEGQRKLIAAIRQEAAT